MHHNHKLATCCYCGHRTLLRLGGTVERHELACGACGAPLHAMKSLPKRDSGAAAPKRMQPPRAADLPRRRGSADGGKPRKRRRKSFAKRLFDFVEDAAEEVFDILD